MKYIAPTVLNTMNATNHIQGGKTGIMQDSQHPLDFNSNGAGYDADE
jgi:hypothetical protein